MAKYTNCQFCQKPTKARKGKKYCSEICRWRAWASLIDSQEVTVACVYCGVPADSIDHIPPRAYRGYTASSPELAHKYPEIEVNACRECNSGLGARPLWTLHERKSFIKKWLARRYSKYIKCPDWQECEINELGYNLKVDVERSMLIKKWAKSRLEW